MSNGANVDHPNCFCGLGVGRGKTKGRSASHGLLPIYKGYCQQPSLSSAKLVKVPCVPQAGQTRYVVELAQARTLDSGKEEEVAF